MEGRLSYCILWLFIIGISFYMLNPVGNGLTKLNPISSRTKGQHFQPIHVLPHAIIIGEKKCGTYALIRMIDDIYPNVRAMKGEPRFFSLHYEKGVGSYIKSLPAMESPDDIVIEKSPSYTLVSDVPSRIYKDSPKSKFILIVCDPVKRVISNYIQGKWKGLISNRTSLVKYLTLPNGELDTSKYVLKASQYAQHIKPWLSLFPRKQILIVDGQNLVENPYREIVKVEKFLGLPKLVKNTTFLKDTETNFPCWISYKGKNCIEKPGRKGRKHPETKGEVKLLVDKLREYFIPRNKEFFSLTGTEFNWAMNKA